MVYKLPFRPQDISVSFSKYGTEYKRYVLEGYDKDTEMLDEQYSELNELSNEAAYPYENVIRYKTKVKQPQVYTQTARAARCAYKIYKSVNV